jgi:putative flippase GtrA
MQTIRALIKKYSFLIRYGISGATGGFLQTFLLWVWVSLLGLEEYYLWGLVVGFCITIMVTFSMQKYWTFGDKEHHHRTRRQFVLYAATAVASLALNTLLLFLSKEFFERSGYDFFHIWYLIVQVIIIFIVAFLSFLFNFLITFKEKKDHTLGV